MEGGHKKKGLKRCREVRKDGGGRRREETAARAGPHGSGEHGHRAGGRSLAQLFAFDDERTLSCSDLEIAPNFLIGN